ncbi:MAG: DUF4937 domain-containing protein, partial [Deltaproteobacteria bacterium]
MVIKWIVCRVPEGKRNSFDEAQQAWKTISESPGFLGQIGGWNRHDPSEACIAAFWQDEAAYRNFMDRIHDGVTQKNAQAQTYDAIEVRDCQALFEMPGSERGILQAAAHATLLRVADCTLKPGRDEHFVEVQKSVWIPAMTSTAGMSWGTFTRYDRAGSYLVLSLWKDAASHDRYRVEQVPRLREKARVDEDLEALTGRFVPLLP